MHLFPVALFLLPSKSPSLLLLLRGVLWINTLKNYRPISNLPFLSKVIEKAASRQVMAHVDSNNLGEPFQSSYKRHHSTETALLKVKNDLLRSLDNNKAVLMVLLDMSAAFETVDHDILLARLESKIGIGNLGFPPTSRIVSLKSPLMANSPLIMSCGTPYRRVLF